MVVVGEYDPTADFPDRPWNILALTNSLFGFQSSHGPSALSSPTEVPEENIREREERQGRHHNHLPRGRERCYPCSNHSTVCCHPQSSARPTTCSSRSWTAAYSRNDATNGNRMPYLKPTDGLPQLVKPAKVTDSFKATPDVSALPRLDSALSALDRSTAPKSSPLARIRERSANRLQRLNNLTDSWHPGRNPDPAVAEALS